MRPTSSVEPEFVPTLDDLLATQPGLTVNELILALGPGTPGPSDALHAQVSAWLLAHPHRYLGSRAAKAQWFLAGSSLINQERAMAAARRSQAPESRKNPARKVFTTAWSSRYHESSSCLALNLRQAQRMTARVALTKRKKPCEVCSWQPFGIDRAFTAHKSRRYGYMRPTGHNLA